MSYPERGEFAGSWLPSSQKNPLFGSSQPWHIPGCQGVKEQAGVAWSWSEEWVGAALPEFILCQMSWDWREETGMEEGNEGIPNSPQMKNSGEGRFWQMKQFPMAEF